VSVVYRTDETIVADKAQEFLEEVTKKTISINGKKYKIEKIMIMKSAVESLTEEEEYMKIKDLVERAVSAVAFFEEVGGWKKETVVRCWSCGRDAEPPMDFYDFFFERVVVCSENALEVAVGYLNYGEKRGELVEEIEAVVGLRKIR